MQWINGTLPEYIGYVYCEILSAMHIGKFMILSKEYWHREETSNEIKERQWIARIAFRTSKTSKSVKKRRNIEKHTRFFANHPKNSCA
jgi:hypothetical protein